MLLLLPTIAPPAPPISAPVPAPLAVFDGATPEEQPDKPASASAVVTPMNCLRTGPKRAEIGKGCMGTMKSGSDEDLDSLKLRCVRFYSTATMYFPPGPAGVLPTFEILEI